VWYNGRKQLNFRVFMCLSGFGHLHYDVLLHAFEPFGGMRQFVAELDL
jgi:hypothetical protein